MNTLSTAIAIIQRVPLVIANWILLYEHQVKLILFHEPSRDRAIQCLIPPTIFLFSLLGIIGLSASKPRFVWSILPRIPWVAAPVGIAIFAMIAKPALWDHTCTTNPITLSETYSSKAGKAQLQSLWKDLNPAQADESAWKYRARMDEDISKTWTSRSQTELQEWVNVQMQARDKQKCLERKDEIFRESVGAWRGRVGESGVGKWWSQAIMDAEVCRPPRTMGWDAKKKKGKWI